MLPTCSPKEVGISEERLQRAFALLQKWTEDGTLPGATALVARHGRIAGRFYTGWARMEPKPEPVTRDTIFAVASITKPFTATGLMLLVERGLVSLDQPVRTVLPEFVGPSRDGITLRHFLTHTSGLPEYAPNNQEIRRQHLGLDAFVEAYCQGEPLFEPGTRHSYSNYGFGLTGEIIGRLSGRSYHQFIHEEILAPLGMKDSYMQPPEEVWDRIAWVWAPNEPHTDYERYNSPYFRRLGIPWGCLYTTPEDLALFAQMFLTAGKSAAGKIISPATAREMTRDQLRGIPGGIESSAESWRAASWGLGWDVKGHKAPHSTGQLTSPQTFGHGGSAGSMIWADPVTGVICVLIANRTLESGWTTAEMPRQALFSNAVCAAVVD